MTGGIHFELQAQPHDLSFNDYKGRLATLNLLLIASSLIVALNSQDKIFW